jgi:hypothetical protein
MSVVLSTLNSVETDTELTVVTLYKTSKFAKYEGVA